MFYRLNNIHYLLFGVPITLVLSILSFSKTQSLDSFPASFSIAITLDLLFTIPIVYYTN